jgi:hypothetical protein
MGRTFGILAFCLSVYFGATLTSPLARAADGGSRTLHRFGLYAGLGDPFPSLWGIHAGYNLADFLRVTAGYGSFTYFTVNVTSMNVGVKGFVPGWKVSPMVGVNYNLISSNATTITVNTLTFANPAGTNLNALTLNLGVDWQTDGGFLLGGAYNLPVGNALWSGGSTFGIYIGYFFL